jgi:hypothetical protein
MLVCKSPGYGISPKNISQVVGKRAKWINIIKYLFYDTNTLGTSNVTPIDSTLLRVFEKLFEKDKNDEVDAFYYQTMITTDNVNYRKIVYDWVLRNEDFVFSNKRLSLEFFTQTVKFLSQSYYFDREYMENTVFPLIFKRIRENKILDETKNRFSIFYNFIFKSDLQKGWGDKDFFFPDSPELFDHVITGAGNNVGTRSVKFINEKIVNGHPLIIKWLKNRLVNDGDYIDNVNELNSKILFIDDNFVDDAVVNGLKVFYSKKENQERIKPIIFFNHSKKLTDAIRQIYGELIKDPAFLNANISNLLLSFKDLDPNIVFKNFVTANDFADELMTQNQVDLTCSGKGQDILKSIISIADLDQVDKIDNHGLIILFGAIERINEKATKNPLSKSYVSEYNATIQRMIRRLNEISPARADEIFDKLSEYSKKNIAEYENKHTFLRNSLANILGSNSPIKPSMSIDDKKLEFILERNSVVTPKVVTKAKSYTELKAKTSENIEKGKIKDLAVKEIQKDPDYFLRKSAEFDVFNNGRHQEIAVKFLREFDVDLEIQRASHDKFMKDNPNSVVIAQAFHGCGSVAAAFILRYGYAVFKAGNSAINVAGKMLSPALQRIRRKKV